MDWAEKHRPKTLKDVAGNPTALAELKKWAESWGKRKSDKRAVVLSGPPGVGKTSAALALAAEMGWGILEMNASDKRNAEAVRKIALTGAITQTFSVAGEYLRTSEGKRTLIVLDEADNLFGREDFGGIGAIVDTLRQTRQPIVLIVNDYYELTRRSGAIKSLAKQIKFQKLTPAAVKSALRRVAEAERLHVPDEALDAVVEHAAGDMRSAVNDLQALAVGRKEVRAEDVSHLGYRDVETSVFDALREIFQSGDAARARRSTEGLDEDPEKLILWVDENLPYEYRDPADLARAYDCLSRADLYLGRVQRIRAYRFWAYASDLMTAGVAMARHGRWAGGQYRFPVWIMKMARTRGRRQTTASLCRKLGAGLHTSSRRVLLDLLPSFRQIFAADEEFQEATTVAFEFTEKELAYLLETEEDDRRVRELAALLSEAPAAAPSKAGLAGFEEEDT